MRELSATEKKLASVLLDLAADSYGNHGCNDLDPEIVALVPAYESEALLLRMNQWNGGPKEDYIASMDRVPDYFLMAYLADRLSEASGI